MVSIAEAMPPQNAKNPGIAARGRGEVTKTAQPTNRPYVAVVHRTPTNPLLVSSDASAIIDIPMENYAR